MTFNLSHCELANDNSLPWMDVFGVKYKHMNSLHINSPLDQLPLARQVLDMSIAPMNSKPSSHSYVTVKLYVDDVFEILPFLSSGGPPQSTPVEYTVTRWLTTVTHVTMCGRAIRGYNTTSVGVLRVTVISLQCKLVYIWRAGASRATGRSFICFYLARRNPVLQLMELRENRVSYRTVKEPS